MQGDGIRLGGVHSKMDKTALIGATQGCCGLQNNEAKWPGQVEQPGQAGQLGQPGQGRGVQAGQNFSKVEWPGQPGQLGQPGPGGGVRGGWKNF